MSDGALDILVLSIRLSPCLMVLLTSCLRLLKLNAVLQRKKVCRVRWNLSELKEIKSFICERNIWDVLYPPPGANIMTLKGVCTVKTNGELKSRLVARGFK